MTKAELARLVRVARSAGRAGHYRGVDSPSCEFNCPVHLEALRASGERYMSAHRFEAWGITHLGDPTTVAAVTRALAQHLADAEINGEPCNRI